MRENTNDEEIQSLANKAMNNIDIRWNSIAVSPWEIFFLTAKLKEEITVNLKLRNQKLVDTNSL